MNERQFDKEKTQLNHEQILEAGKKFLTHFGVEINPSENLEKFNEALAQLDPRYQGGRELVRWQLEADQTHWDEETKSLIMETAESMRMLEAETPLKGDFDIVIALGGARQANLDRIRYAVEAIKSGETSVAQLIISGSSRELNEAEQQNASNYAPGANTEFDLCVGAAAAVAKENPGLITSVLLVDEKRAGTPMVIEKTLDAARKNGFLPKNAKVAAVTTQIYQASTELDLARVCSQFGITESYTAGNPSDPEIVAKRTPATYMSEVLRTLRAATNAAEAEVKAKKEAHEQHLAKIEEEREKDRLDYDAAIAAGKKPPLHEVTVDGGWIWCDYKGDQW